MIAYACMMVATTVTTSALGPRVRALREAMDLSLRDLAERSGVSAPMLSQVERGETSPTLQVAKRIAVRARAAALAAAAARRGRRRHGRAPSRAPQGPGPPPAVTATRSSLRRFPASEPSSHATRSSPARSPAAPAIHRCTSRAAVRRRWSSRGAVVLVCDGQALRAGRGRLRDLRRRPATPFREPRTRRGRDCWPW